MEKGAEKSGNFNSCGTVSWFLRGAFTQKHYMEHLL